jgi:hypothetical protein
MDVTWCYSLATYIILEDTTGITLGPGYQYIYEKLSIENKFLLTNYMADPKHTKNL